MSVQIVPQLLPQTSIIQSFKYYVERFILNQEIEFKIIYFDKNENVLSGTKVILAGEDYHAWGNDDNYVIQYICNALGLTIAIPVEPEVPVQPEVPVLPDIPFQPQIPLPPEVPVEPEALSA
uniref:Uncharacterized protein n=1 Tax=viral metagenome TaxID=1070528 RepID=A0A6C0DX03_9ZZZZ